MLHSKKTTIFFLITISLLLVIIFIFITLFFLNPNEKVETDAFVGKVVFQGEKFTLVIPKGFTINAFGKDHLSLDPPGEGPDPYEQKTGEGINPFDDINMSVMQNSLERIVDNLNQYIVETENVTISDTQGLKLRVNEGISPYYVYLVSLDAETTLYIQTFEHTEYVDGILQAITFKPYQL